MITGTQKLAIVSFFLLMFLAGTYIFAYRHIGGMREAYLVARDESMVRSEEAKVEQMLVSLVEETREVREGLFGYLIAEKNTTPFLSAVESVASDAHISVEFETLAEQEGGKGASGQGIVRAVLNVGGGWSQLHHFLVLIEHMPYAVTIEALNVEELQDEKGVWSGHVTLTVPIQRTQSI